MVNKFAAASALIGTIIGAGILGIPYVVVKSGFPLGMLNLVVAGIVVMIISLYLGEITLRTKKNHQLPGYAEKYLGKNGKKIMILVLAFDVYSAIIAYMIGVSESLSFLIFGDPSHTLLLGIAFWIFMSGLTYEGMRALKKGEEIGVILILIFIISIAILYGSKIETANLAYSNLSNIFTPFGVMLFAFLAFAAIPEVKKIIGSEKRHMKKIIISSYILTAVIYAVFALIVVGSQGQKTPELATLTLGIPFIVLGILTMFTSYLALSIALADSLTEDYNYSKKKSWMLTIFFPLIIFILLEIFSLSSFTKVLSIGGIISVTMMATMIMLMIKNSRKNSEVKPPYEMPYSKEIKWVFIAIIILFALGGVLEVINII